MKSIVTVSFALLLATSVHADEAEETMAACVNAFKSLVKADKSYEKMQRVSCNSAMGHSKKYWVCVKQQVDAGADPKTTAQHCPEE